MTILISLRYKNKIYDLFVDDTFVIEEAIQIFLKKQRLYMPNNHFIFSYLNNCTVCITYTFQQAHIFSGDLLVINDET